MPKAKDVKLDEKDSKKTPELEAIMEEGAKLEAEEAKKAEEAAKAKEEEDKEEEVEVDLDKFKEDTKKETIDKIAEEVITPLKEEIAKLTEAGKTKEEKSEIRIELEALQAKAKAEDRELSYDEALEFVTNKATDAAIAKIEEKAQVASTKAKEDEEAAKKTQSETDEANFKYWQKQLEEMESKEMLPKMEKAEEGDKGFDARVKLYGFMQGTWKSDAPLTNMYEVFTKLYKPEEDKANKQPPGADAPVGMGGQTGTKSDEDNEFKYSDIHNKSNDLEGFLIDMMKDQG